MFQNFKKFGQQIITYGLADTINKVLAILIVPLFTRYLSPADYGVAGVLTVSAVLIIGVCDLGLSNGITRFFKEEVEPEKSKLISTSTYIMVFFSLALALIATPFSSQISVFLFKSAEYGQLILLNLYTIPLTISVTAPMMRFRLEEKAKLYASINIARVVTGLALNIYLIVFLGHGLRGIFEGPLINSAIYAVIIGILNLKYNGFKFSWALFKKMFIFASPFVFGLVAFWIMDWADRFILTRMTNLTEVGLYSLGYSIGMAIMLPVGAFSTAWPPFFMSLSDKEDAPKIFSLIFTYYSLIIGFLVLIISVFSRDYFIFFTPEAYHSAYIVAPMVAFAYALKGNFTIVAAGAFLKKRTVFELTSDIIAVVINIVAMVILIPYLGRIGAAWATVLAYLALPISMYLLSLKIFPIKYDFKRLIYILLVGFSLFFICNAIYEPTLLNVLARVLLVIAYPVIFIFFGFLNADEKKRLTELKNKVFSKKLEIEPTASGEFHE